MAWPRSARCSTCSATSRRSASSADVAAARARLRGTALHTPLEPSAQLAATAGAAEVRLKREELPPTGAFKTRAPYQKVANAADARADCPAVNWSMQSSSV